MSAPPEILSQGSLYALPLVFGAGLVAGLNPCCLAMYPAATATCCATPSNWHRRLAFSLLFVFGAALSTAILGVVAAVLGRAMGQLGAPVQYVIALIPMVMGFQLLGWIRLPMNQRVSVRIASSAAGTAFLVGMVLGIVISPCGTPILASVLSYVAYKRSVLFGAVLLFVYGVGSSAPVALIGSAGGTALERWGSPRLHAIANSVTGGLLAVTSFYLLWRI